MRTHREPLPRLPLSRLSECCLHHALLLMPDLRLTPPLLTAEAMRAADRYTMETYGIPNFALMESAGRAAADVLMEAYGPAGEAALLVLCGKGNNGGDGLVVARQWATAGARVHVVLMHEPDALRDAPARNLDLLRHLRDESPAGNRITITTFADVDTLAAETQSLQPTLAVDALLGTGLTSDVREPMASVVRWLNDHPGPVAALDIPTGLHSDTGQILGDAVRAERTVTMAAQKVGLVLGEGPACTGAVDVVEIGIPPFVIDDAEESHAACARATSDAAAAAWWPRRARDAYKYSAGTVLVVGGAPPFAGAPAMAAQAAARSGAGYVMCAAPAPVRPALAAKLTTVPVHGLPVADDGGLDPDAALDALASLLDTADALLVGPGLGRDASTEQFVRALLQQTALPTVIDADGLNALAADVDALADHANGQWLLTPHAGEFRRLAGDMDLTLRVRTAQTHAMRWNSTVLLKGQPSLAAGPDGPVYVSAAPSPALATAGTGDVLAGQCAALLAQGVAPPEAAACALHLGGRAAQRYAERRDARTMVATDLIDALPRVAHALGDRA